MRVIDLEDCVRMMPVITGEKSLLQMSISQYPHSKDEYRKKLHKDIYKMAHPSDTEKEALAIEGLASLLSRGGK